MASTSTLPKAEEAPFIRKIKKKRLPGACDECRRKKAKCDSAQMPGNSCTNCASFDIPCTHDLPRRKQKTETEMSIPVLHARIKRLEDFVRRLYPDEDLEVILSRRPEETPPPHSGSQYAIPRSMSPDSPPVIKEEETSGLPDEEDLAHVSLVEHLGRLSVNPIDDRFFGPSSAFMFAKHVSIVRCEAMGKPYEPTDPTKHRRRSYWDIRPWEMAYATSSDPPYVYPDHDLLLSLVSFYFENSNNIIPILHRPSFMKSLSHGQHHWDPSFGMTVLLVCALGSRYSHDARVRVANDESGLSAGWNYFSQVPLHRKMMFYKSTIYDLQYYALASMYLVGSCIPNATWHIMGVGLRHALEKGIHRRTGPPTVESEMQKRAFWALVCLDRLGCSFVGRPSGYPHEIFDVDYPIECDDEYWETDDPEKAFQQPPGKPCKVSAFIAFIKLCEILSFVLRTLYANKKSKIQAGYIGHEWEVRMVAELDSSMNKWKESLPEYLRWDPKRQNTLFFKQSVSIHTTYYHIQIQIHRQFLTKQSALSFSSLAVCTNAARSCAHVLEVAGTREFFVMPNVLTAAFVAGVVIALNLWGTQRSGYITDTQEEIKNFKKCINYLARCENRWNQAGRFIDMLREVSSLDEYEPTARKRRRSTSPAPEALIAPKRVYREPMPAYSHAPTYGQVPIATPTVDLRAFAIGEGGNIARAGGGGGGGYSHPDFHSLQAINSMHPISAQPQGINPSGIPANAQTSPYVFDFPSGNDMFALWAELPTTFNSFEEWEAYSLSVG